MRSLFAADTALETPFAPPHVPRALKGIDEIFNCISGFFQLLRDDFEITQKSIHPVQGRTP
ncbi:hypothetical protein CI102_9878 [Trichoderma harzianum]|nr:hypothetical protein CI102_9878 [Trichoderma harzianum]